MDREAGTRPELRKLLAIDLSILLLLLIGGASTSTWSRSLDRWAAEQGRERLEPSRADVRPVRWGATRIALDLPRCTSGSS